MAKRAAAMDPRVKTYLKQIAKPIIGTCWDCREDGLYLNLKGQCHNCFGKALGRRHAGHAR